MTNGAAPDDSVRARDPGGMRLHSTLHGRARGFRLRGAAWEVDEHAFRGFVYLIPLHGDGDPRYRIVEAAGADLWTLLAGIERQVATLSGSAVARLDATLVDARGRDAEQTASVDSIRTSRRDR